MRLSTLLFTLAAAAAAALPSTYAITCAIGKIVADANGQIDISRVASFSCPSQVTQCATLFMREALNVAEPRYVVLSCQPTPETCDLQTIVSPDHWAEVRCCTGINCNKQGLNNIDWSDRTSNQGNNPTIPSTPTISSNPTIQPAPTQAPANTRIRCREGSTIPAGNGQIGPDTDSWSSSTCQEGQSFCVTFFQRTDDNKFVMANCADRCTPSVFVTTPTQWIETTCCSGDNCNNDINKIAIHDWGVRTANITGSPATKAPNSGTNSPTTRGPFSASSSISSSFVMLLTTLALAALVMLY